MNLLLTMISNISILAFFGVILSRGTVHLQGRHRWMQMLYPILSATLMSVLITQYPLLAPTGARYELRAVPVVVAGVFGGPVVGGMVTLSVALFRLGLGGPWARYGAIDILIQGTCAAALHRYVAGRKSPYFKRWRVLVPCYLGAMISTTYALFAIPNASLTGHLTNLLPLLLFFQPLAVLILTWVLQHDLQASDRRERLLEQVDRDTKTQLLNSQAFDQLLMGWLGVPSYAPVSVLFMDLDLFKRVNDGFGHDIGDEVLREVSERLIRSVRPEDRVARYGGEEFTVALPQCDFGMALSIADRIRQIIANQPFCQDRTKGGIPLTISVGVATANDDDAAQLLRKADQAMYAAKGAGRNKVVGYSVLLGPWSVAGSSHYRQA